MIKHPAMTLTATNQRSGRLSSRLLAIIACRDDDVNKVQTHSLLRETRQKRHTGAERVLRTMSYPKSTPLVRKREISRIPVRSIQGISCLPKSYHRAEDDRTQRPDHDCPKSGEVGGR